MRCSSFLSRSLLAFSFCLGGLGCAAEPSAADDADEASSSAALLGIDVPNPSGAYFASVTANGTGCPAGTWDAKISADGKSLAVVFDTYGVVLNPGQAMALKDCTLGIDLRSPARLSFAVSHFHYDGAAVMDSPGMMARLTPRYYFQGMPVGAKEYRSFMMGPYDDTFVFDEEIGPVDLVWSPCGTTRRLNAQTRLVVINNPQHEGSAVLNLEDAALTVRFDLAWRHC